jgi:hypothetical protein
MRFRGVCKPRVEILATVWPVARFSLRRRPAGRQRFDSAGRAGYHEICAGKPGDRCPVQALRFGRGKQGRGRGKSELRRAVCSLTARAGGGCPTIRAVRLRHGKCHRKHTAPSNRSKGEKVRQERTAPVATSGARQTPHGARPNRRGGAARPATSRLGPRLGRGQTCGGQLSGRSLDPASNRGTRGMIAPRYRRGQNSAYRLVRAFLTGARCLFSIRRYMRPSPACSGIRGTIKNFPPMRVTR